MIPSSSAVSTPHYARCSTRATAVRWSCSAWVESGLWRREPLPDAIELGVRLRQLVLQPLNLLHHLLVARPRLGFASLRALAALAGVRACLLQRGLDASELLGIAHEPAQHFGLLAMLELHGVREIRVQARERAIERDAFARGLELANRAPVDRIRSRFCLHRRAGAEERRAVHTPRETH